jgi:hypothetical protein
VAIEPDKVEPGLLSWEWDRATQFQYRCSTLLNQCY